MRVSEVGEKRPDWAEWKDAIEEVELRREVDHAGGVGSASGGGGGFARSGRVFGPSDLKDIVAATINVLLDINGALMGHGIDVSQGWDPPQGCADDVDFTSRVRLGYRQTPP